MKPVMLVGIILIVLGLVALAYKGITYTTQEEVAKIGPLEAKVQKEKTIPLPRPSWVAWRWRADLCWWSSEPGRVDQRSAGRRALTDPSSA
jgi:hypothetical protein